MGDFKTPADKAIAGIGVLFYGLYILAILAFWGGLGYAIYHFAKKWW